MDETAFGEALQALIAQVVPKADRDRDFAVVGIRTRGVALAQRIARRLSEQLGREIPVGILDINLYRDDMSVSSSQPIVRSTELGFPVEGAHILLVDDVLFTGRTVRAAISALIDYGRPSCVELLVMVARSGRELPIQADYLACEMTTTASQRVDVLVREEDGRDAIIVRDA